MFNNIKQEVNNSDIKTNSVYIIKGRMFNSSVVIVIEPYDFREVCKQDPNDYGLRIVLYGLKNVYLKECQITDVEVFILSTGERFKLIS